MDEESRYREAKKRVDELKGFYIHLGVFVAVNLGLFLINLATNRDNWWFYWPMLGWGIAIIIHAFTLFAGGRFSGAWEERKIQELMTRDDAKRPPTPTH
ncbi:MAG TPA: 2TM domain-containing protein [Thermomicrobiales bacterium]|nr:2TM domain-containing protein [Thermomicrobiales bacterium]